MDRVLHKPSRFTGERQAAPWGQRQFSVSAGRSVHPAGELPRSS